MVRAGAIILSIAAHLLPAAPIERRRLETSLRRTNSRPARQAGEQLVVGPNKQITVSRALPLPADPLELARWGRAAQVAPLLSCLFVGLDRQSITNHDQRSSTSNK